MFIESTVNGYQIKIVIECKDWKSTIPVEKIEAFESKCKRIKGISKKVFVSQNGFQKDACDAAADFDIELFTANKLDRDSVHSPNHCP